MNDTKREILNALERIDYYGADNPQLATELPITVELFAANKINITRLHQAGVTSDASSAAGTSGTRSKVARSRSIHSDLRRVARTAKVLERKIPGFQNVFEMPGGSLSYQDLTDRTDAFIANRAKHKSEFTKRGLNDEFFADLQQDLDELREVSEEQADAKRIGVGATADTEAILEDALETRSELRNAIENHYRANPARLAEWLTACRIERRRTKAGTPPAGEDEKPA